VLALGPTAVILPFSTITFWSATVRSRSIGMTVTFVNAYVPRAGICCAAAGTAIVRSRADASRRALGERVLIVPPRKFCGMETEDDGIGAHGQSAGDSREGWRREWRADPRDRPAAALT
jgi:hypothetical protein